MSLCILGLGKVLTLSATMFTLSWTHSVEKTQWQERWRVSDAGLEIVEARVKGSGGGMDPPADAFLKDGWWIFRPQLPMQRMIALAASGAIQEGWLLCTDTGCQTLGSTAGHPIVIRPCGFR